MCHPVRCTVANSVAETSPVRVIFTPVGVWNPLRLVGYHSPSNVCFAYPPLPASPGVAAN